jgi:hypothetical protein
VNPRLLSTRELGKTRIALAQTRMEQSAVRGWYSAEREKAQDLQQSITDQEQRMEKLSRAVGKSRPLFGAGPDSSMVAPAKVARAFAFGSACCMIRERCRRLLAAFQAKMDESRAECGRMEKGLAAINGRIELLEKRSRRISRMRLAAADSLDCAENEDRSGLRACRHCH